jgi:hypothetical protein
MPVQGNKTRSGSGNFRIFGIAKKDGAPGHGPVLDMQERVIFSIRAVIEYGVQANFCSRSLI